MAEEMIRLAADAAGLRYEDLPAPVVRQAKDCIIDTVAAGICGSALPWSRIVIDYAERTGPGTPAFAARRPTTETNGAMPVWYLKSSPPSS